MLNSKARIVEVSPRAANGKNPNQAMNPRAAKPSIFFPGPTPFPAIKTHRQHLQSKPSLEKCKDSDLPAVP